MITFDSVVAVSIQTKFLAAKFRFTSPALRTTAAEVCVSFRRLWTSKQTPSDLIFYYSISRLFGARWDPTSVTYLQGRPSRRLWGSDLATLSQQHTSHLPQLCGGRRGGRQGGRAPPRGSRWGCGPEAFCLAVAQDTRSYSQGLFTRAGGGGVGEDRSAAGRLSQSAGTDWLMPSRSVGGEQSKWCRRLGGETV